MSEKRTNGADYGDQRGGVRVRLDILQAERAVPLAPVREMPCANLYRQPAAYEFKSRHHNRLRKNFLNYTTGQVAAKTLREYAI
jgi:hypothetical protein